MVHFLGWCHIMTPGIRYQFWDNRFGTIFIIVAVFHVFHIIHVGGPRNFECLEDNFPKWKQH